MLRWFAMMGLVVGLVAGTAFAEEAAQDTEGGTPAVGAGQETQPSEPAPAEGSNEPAPAEENPKKSPPEGEAPSPD